MIKDILLDITAPVIPASKTYTHTHTKWKISRDADQLDLIEPIVDDTINLVSKPLSLEMEDDDVIYVSVNVCYSDGSDEGWSSVVKIHGTDSGFKYSNTLIRTPTLTLKGNVTDADTSVNFEVSNDGLVLFSGSGTLKSTSWYVTDSSGNIVWKREYDEDNLESIKIPSSVLDEGRTYIVKCQLHTDTSSSSNYGKLILAADVIKIVPITVYTEEIELNNEITRVDMLISKNGFVGHDWELLDSFNTRLLEGTGRTIDINPNALTLGKEYVVNSKVEFSTGVVENLTFTLRAVAPIDRTFLKVDKVLKGEFAYITPEYFVTEDSKYSLLTVSIDGYERAYSKYLNLDDKGFYITNVYPDGLFERVDLTTDIVNNGLNLESGYTVKIIALKDNNFVLNLEYDILILKLDIVNKTINLVTREEVSTHVSYGARPLFANISNKEVMVMKYLDGIELGILKLDTRAYSKLVDVDDDLLDTPLSMTLVNEEVIYLETTNGRYFISLITGYIRQLESVSIDATTYTDLIFRSINNNVYKVGSINGKTVVSELNPTTGALVEVFEDSVEGIEHFHILANHRSTSYFEDRTSTRRQRAMFV